MSKCEAVQHSDEMACGRCGLRWDVSDESPPACGKDVEAVAGRVDLSKALAALNRTTESRAGLLHAANGSSTRAAAFPNAHRIGVTHTPVPGSPITDAMFDAKTAGPRLSVLDLPPPEFAAIPHDNFDQGEHRSDARRRDDRAEVMHFSGRRSGKTTAAEAWMVDAVARGEVVLQERRPGPHLLAFGPWRMPAELPEAALDAMRQAEPAFENVSKPAMRAAYRELLAYLGQA